MAEGGAVARWSGGIDLYLWNNCADDHAIYEQAIREHGLTGALRSIHLIKSPMNLGSIARFYVARTLATDGLAGPVIILDDDEVVTPWFVRKAIWRYDPKALTAWWAFQVAGAYWDKTPVERGQWYSVVDLKEEFFTWCRSTSSSSPSSP